MVRVVGMGISWVILVSGLGCLINIKLEHLALRELVGCRCVDVVLVGVKGGTLLTPSIQSICDEVFKTFELWYTQYNSVLSHLLDSYTESNI